LLAAHLVPKELYFTLETGYERAGLMYYPAVLYIVYPSSTLCVQVDVDPAAAFFVVLQCPTGHSLADGALGDPELAGGLLDGYSVAVHVQDGG